MKFIHKKAILIKMLRRAFSTKKFLLTGASGQIGQKLVPYLYQRYGPSSVVVSDLKQVNFDVENQPPFTRLDVTDRQAFSSYVKSETPTCILHLSAILSATAEKFLDKSFQVNVIGSQNALEIAVENKCSIYIPSTIAVFGPNVPRLNTGDDVVLQPTTVYGISKVYMELMGSYYHKKFGVDFRSIRYPGAISSDPPGGGTTDYAVQIYFELIKKKSYECFLSKNTMLPMMYIDDLIRGTCDFLDIPSERLTRRVYNFAAISFTPRELFQAIEKYIPGSSITYNPDHRQAYADSWPMSIDDSNARADWGWKHQYDIDSMTRKMIELITKANEKKVMA